MENSIQASTYIAQTIKDNEITHVFYVDAILRMTMKELGRLGVKGIMTHTENSAGYMADGYARVSGKQGICMAQSIGAANMVGGIEDAWLAHSPVIAITGKKPPQFQYKNSYQEADHRLFYEGITKFNADLAQVDQLPYLLRRCFRDSVAGKPGPVHLDIPNEMGRLTEKEMIPILATARDQSVDFPPFRQAADPVAIRRAADVIDQAERPVIVAGRGAALSDAGDEILKLAIKGDIPIVTSPDGKALIDEDDPLWAGIVGNYGMACANKTVQDADVVIFIGTQTGDQTTLNWKVPTPQTKAVQIDVDATQFCRNYPDTVGLLGDAKTVTAQLTGTIEKRANPKWKEIVTAYREETLALYQRLQQSDGTPIRPEKLCAEISDALPDDAILVSDTGYSAIWSATMIKMRASQKYFRAAGSLGWAFPASLGMKCACPDKPVFCFTGDGAFYYHMSEMETAARYGINTVTIINNNQALGQCIIDLKNVYHDELENVEAKYAFSSVSFSKIAEEMGCIGIRIENPEEIGAALEKAAGADKPVVIEVITEAEAFVPANI